MQPCTHSPKIMALHLCRENVVVWRESFNWTLDRTTPTPDISPTTNPFVPLTAYSRTFQP
jgi:hypothetical protein